MENPYHILGISPNATGEEIKKAYRVLAMRHHPDRNSHANSISMFNSVKIAYELLSDPKKRAAYNQSINNRIILDPEEEAHTLWSSLFRHCGITF